MKVKLTDHAQRQEVYSSSLNTRVCVRRDFFHPNSIIKYLQINELRFNGINYLSIKLEAKDSSAIHVEYTQPGYLICFVLEGSCNIEIDETMGYITAHQYSCYPIQKSTLLTLSSNTNLLLVSIDLEKTQGINTINEKPGKLLPPMNSIISEIKQCTEDCPILCIFIESKILSLLYLVFKEFKKEDFPSNSVIDGLSEKDIQKLRAAKVFIVKNIAKNYTLIELAHEVGLNDFKLKKGFRELFGSTVFTYRHSIRMEKAKELLKSGFQINEVSEEIGYKHPHHFSAAFKEYYNILPSRIRK